MCGYVNADAQDLLPEEAAGQTEQEEGVYLHMYNNIDDNNNIFYL